MKQKTNEITYEKDFLGATLEDGKITRIPATVDFMFKNLFGVNGKEENLKGLLEAILKIKIDSLEIQNPELPREHKKDKLGILDVKAKLEDGTIASIEMQVKNEKNLGDRMTFYICKLHISSLKIGGKYSDATKTIVIAITNFSYFNRKEYHQIAHLKFEECKDKNEIVDDIFKGEESKLLTDKLEVHIIDLHKFKKMKEPRGELADWLNLIMGNEEGIEIASKRNETISKINEENKELSKDQQLREMFADLSREMAIMDENTRKFEEEEAKRKMKEAEEVSKRKMKEAEEVSKRKMKEAEEVSKRKMKEAEESKRKMKEAEEESKRKMKEAEEESKRKMKEAEEVSKRKMKEAEEVSKRKMKEAEEVVKRKMKEVEETKIKAEKEAEETKRKADEEIEEAKKEKGRRRKKEQTRNR